MSSTKKGSTSMPVRIDDEIYAWWLILKDATGSSSISEAMRQTILMAHPNIGEIAGRVQRMESKRNTILLDLEGLPESGEEADA